MSLLRPHGIEWAVETEGIQLTTIIEQNVTSISSGPLITLLNKEIYWTMFPIVEATAWIEKTNLSKCEFF